MTLYAKCKFNMKIREDNIPQVFNCVTPDRFPTKYIKSAFVATFSSLAALFLCLCFYVPPLVGLVPPEPISLLWLQICRNKEEGDTKPFLLLYLVRYYDKQCVVDRSQGSQARTGHKVARIASLQGGKDCKEIHFHETTRTSFEF